MPWIMKTKRLFLLAAVAVVWTIYLGSSLKLSGQEIDSDRAGDIAEFQGEEGAATEEPPAENSRLIQYAEMQQAFEQDAAAFRSQHPVYAEFANVFENKVMPIWHKSELAKQNLLRIQSEKGERIIADTPYDPKREKELIDAVVAEWFSEIITEMDALVKSEKIDLGANEKHRWAALLSLQKRLGHRPKKHDEHEFNDAFSNNDIARTIFESNLGEPIAMVAGILQSVVITLPPDLERQRNLVAQMRRALIAEGLIDFTGDVAGEYMEPYARRISEIVERYKKKTELVRDADEERERTLEGVNKDIPSSAQEEGAVSTTSAQEMTNCVGMKFSLIPAGSFMMGFPDDPQLNGDHERPQHKVNITKAFYMGVTEVTQGQWLEVMGGPVRPGREDEEINPELPVHQASWDHAAAFVAKLSEIDSDFDYRLPTEAEWEYACRAGSTTRFYWGEDRNEQDYDRYMWCEKNAEGTQPVGKKLPNAWGLYDMSGNVMEWCSNWFERYTPEEKTDPVGPSEGREGQDRALRGSSVGNRLHYAGSANRMHLAPNDPAYGDYQGIGFRVIALPSSSKHLTSKTE